MGYGQLLKTDIYNKYNKKCGYCGCNISFDELCIDHIIPKWQGGKANRKNINNMMPSCYACNATKSVMSFEEFRKFVSILPETIGAIARVRLYKKYYGKLKESKGIVFYFEKLEKNIGKK